MPVPVWAESTFLLSTSFVVVIAIAIVIGRAAWMGKPKNWDRSMYWTAFVASIVVSGFFFVCSQRMHADVRTWRYQVQLASFGLGAVLFGIAGGCMVGIFAYGRTKEAAWRAPGNDGSANRL